MTVSYRMSMTDNWHHISYLATKTIIGRCLLALLLATPFAGLVGLWHQPASLHHPTLTPKMHHWMVITSWLMVGGTYVILLFSGLIGLYFGTLLKPTLTITIDAESCRLQTYLGVKSSWKQFLKLVEEPDGFYFVGWLRVFYIPKRAFNSSAEAHTFFDTASAYWRRAKGIMSPPAPDVSGVWPPAPRAGDSQELGGTPKG